MRCAILALRSDGCALDAGKIDFAFLHLPWEGGLIARVHTSTIIFKYSSCALHAQNNKSCAVSGSVQGLEVSSHCAPMSVSAGEAWAPMHAPMHTRT